MRGAKIGRLPKQQMPVSSGLDRHWAQSVTSWNYIYNPEPTGAPRKK